MFKRTASDLSLDSVLSEIASFSLSKVGRDSVLRAIPLYDKQLYLNRQNQVQQIINAQIKAQTSDVYVTGFPDITECFDFMLKNPTGSLNGLLIYDVASFIASAVRLKKLLSLSDDITSDISVFGIIDGPNSDLIGLSEEVFRIVDGTGQVKETYPTIKALIQKAETKRINRAKLASELMHSDNLPINGDNAVLRDGRLVLPIKSDMHSRVEGYIQGTSQTGLTVFMEPFKLIDSNNEVYLALQEIELEKARLLAYLTQQIRVAEQKLRILVSQVAQADFLYSFAAWARKNSCCKVMQSDKYTFNLIKARHPLLKENCVPIDFCVESSCKAVVLTGPNAGGKTVTLKTVGLFSLLNQICGFIPASDGSCLALFDRVFTDIGDDQSIENGLSTFSGHLKSIGFVLRSMTENSLVIFDELGSGTDPQEGAALARSILEFCTDKALLTLTTSHHGVLKQYAYASENVLNASMEFDEQTLQPTFRIISGIPGESHAIDTARRMHLPKSVTFKAQKYLGKEAVKISSVIRGLEQKRHEADVMNTEISSRLAEIKERQQQLEKKQRSLDELENKLKKEGLADFDSFISDARKKLENLVCELREGEITREKTLRVKEQILQFENAKKEKEAEIRQKEQELDAMEYDELLKHKDNIQLKPGMDVLCGQHKRLGTVIKEAGSGKWVVAIGPIKFTFKETDLLVPLKNDKDKRTFYSSVSSITPKLNLDLRGFRMEEAIEAIDREIEACCVHGIKNFSVIHGYGDGILSSGIHSHLKNNPLIDACNFAHPDDGGQGKTYVFLK